MFGDLKDFVANDMTNLHYVPVVDTGISQRVLASQGKQPHMPYLDGVHKDIFLKADSKDNSSYFTGRSFSNDVVYPDFTLKAAQDYWVFWLG